MENKTRPMKAIDFQNKTEGKMEKYDEHLMNALNRITKQENALKDFKEAVELGRVNASEYTKNTRREIVFWQVMAGISVATIITMALSSVLGQ